MRKRAALSAVRLGLGSLALAAVGWQLAIQLRSGFSVVNFLSYFTNLSNLFAAAVLIAGAVWPGGRRGDPATFDTVRGAATVGMALVGVVFAVLLRDVDVGALRPWVNIVLHDVMPIAVVLDWVYDPPRAPLGGRDLQRWLVFPLVYLVYVLTRGAVVGWYPYPFLDPANVGGYGGVAAYAAGISVAFVVLAVALQALARIRRPSVGRAPA